VDFQVRQRLPLVDFKRTFGGQINWQVDCACKERERLLLVGSSETEVAIGSF
jgi:hypothetical protein